jgi:ferredoxin
MRSFVLVAVVNIAMFYNGNALMRPMKARSMALNAKNWSPPPEPSKEADNMITNEFGGKIYTLELPKRAGINWGTDLSFRWVYVSSLESTGEAAQTGLIEKGDYIIGMGNQSMIAQDFDFVLTSLQKQDPVFNYTFFRGTKEQLLGDSYTAPSDITCKVTVKQDKKPDIILECPGGTNIRKLLVGSGINPYRSITRWTNCNGKQRCGTCIVEIEDGLANCTRRALDEEATLRENPENYRLSCVTTIYGDITVKVQGPVGAAQWTR